MSASASNRGKNNLKVGGGRCTIGFMPDRHSYPGCDWRPTKAMARYFADHEVDVIVDIGDRFDMPSLSSYDKAKASFEGRRLSKDIAAARYELDLFEDELNDCGWSGTLVHTRGNHEHRLFRMYDDQPEMMDVLGDDPWSLEEHGYLVYGYQEVMTINGLAFSHCFVNPTSLMGSVQCGTADIRMKNVGFPHCQGHQHGPIVHGKTYRGDGSPISVLVMGASYTEHHGYNGPQRRDVWRGAAILSDVCKGDYDLSYSHIDNLIKYYGVTKR